MSGFDDSGSRGTGSGGIDLGKIPEPMRSLLMKQLGRMPAPLREQLLRDGSPILDRLVAKAREQATADEMPPRPATLRKGGDGGAAASRAVPRQLPAGARDRVPTVMPGDSGHPVGWLLAGAIALAVAAWYAGQG